MGRLYADTVQAGNNGGMETAQISSQAPNELATALEEVDAAPGTQYPDIEDDDIPADGTFSP